MTDQSSVKMLVDKADLLFLMGELNEALKFYSNYLDKYPLDIFVLNNKAALLKKMGNYKDASMCYDEINKIDISFLNPSIGHIEELRWIEEEPEDLYPFNPYSECSYPESVYEKEEHDILSHICNEEAKYSYDPYPEDSYSEFVYEKEEGYDILGYICNEEADPGFIDDLDFQKQISQDTNIDSELYFEIDENSYEIMDKEIREKELEEENWIAYIELNEFERIRQSEDDSLLEDYYEMLLIEEDLDWIEYLKQETQCND